MTGFLCPRRHYPVCRSTNDLAREWALDPSDPAPCGALVTADYQTHGRGRRGSAWQAESCQSALMSFVYRPTVPPAELGQLALVAALALSEALEGLPGLRPLIKWPNDILLNGGKVAGVLVECCYTPSPPKLGGLGPVVILGIGVNVNQERFDGSHTFAYPPTSLRLETGVFRETEAIIEASARSVLHWEERWRKEGFLPILEQCRAGLALDAKIQRRSESGRLIGLTASGGAEVRLADGTFACWTTVD